MRSSYLLASLLTSKSEIKGLEVEEAVRDGGAGSADGLTVDGEVGGRRRNRCSSSALFMSLLPISTPTTTLDVGFSFFSSSLLVTFTWAKPSLT